MAGRGARERNVDKTALKKTGREEREDSCSLLVFWLSDFPGLITLPQPELSVMGKAKANAGPLARRPDNSAFKQQRLPAWSPMLTAQTVLPFFYGMATVCVLLGVWLLVTVQNTHELKVSKRSFRIIEYIYFILPIHTHTHTQSLEMEQVTPSTMHILSNHEHRDREVERDNEKSCIYPENECTV